MAMSGLVVVVAAAAAAAAVGGGQQRLLCSACVRVRPLTHWLALRACGPGQQGGGRGAFFAWLWQCKAAELFGQWRQGGIDGNVRALAAVHPWTLEAAAAATAAGEGQRHLLCSACVGVGLLTRWLALRACGLGRQGEGSSACFTWLVSGSCR
jgi:hypothetical protein